jgi:hypothetical protein
MYSEDVNLFRPERQLESDERARYWEKVGVIFGAGY